MSYPGFDQAWLATRKLKTPAATTTVEPKRKYNNIPTIVNGVLCGSRKEAKRYRELLLLEQAGTISGLSLHNRYSLVVNDVHIADYEDDFTYVRDGRIRVEDSKGVRTPAFALKSKLMLALFGVTVEEV